MENRQLANEGSNPDPDLIETESELESTIPQSTPTTLSIGNPSIWRKYLRKFMNLFFLGNIQRKGAHSFTYPDVEALFSKLGRAIDLEFCKTFYFFFGKYGIFVHEFIFNVIGRFERKLPHLCEHQTIDCHGMARGRILWKKSFDRWFTRECMDFSALTCQSPLKIFNTPENLLLRYVLNQLNDLLKNLAEYLNKFALTGFALGFPVAPEKKSFLEYVQAMQREVAEAISNSYLRRLPLEPLFNAQLINKCEFSRNPDVRQFLVPLYDLLDEITTNQNLAILNDMVKHTLLEILSENTLFEVFVLFRVLEAIGGKNWPQNAKDVGLIRRGRNYVVQFQQLEGYEEIIVFYNLSFTRLADYIQEAYINSMQLTQTHSALKSNAIEIVKSLRNPKLVTRSFFQPYEDLKAKSGRPDIAILFRWHESLILKIVEVKNTNKKNRNYIYRAINTTFIYAANYPLVFSAAPQPQQNCNPNVILALNFGPSIPRVEIDNISGHDRVAIINFANVLDPFRGDLQVLQELLEIPRREKLPL